MEYQELSCQARSLVDRVILEELSIGDLEAALEDESYADEHAVIREALAFLEGVLE